MMNCTHILSEPVVEQGLIVEWRCRCGEHSQQSTFSNGQPVATRAAELAAQAAAPICVCGHRRDEHGPKWCSSLACECRVFRAAEGAQ